MTILQAAGGIGQEIGYSFAEAGATVIVFVDINEQKAKEAAEKSKEFAVRKDYRATAFGVDITDPLSVQRLVDAVVTDCGRIDYSINAAGVCISSPQDRWRG